MAKKNVTFVLDEEMDKKIEIYAAINGIYKSDVVIEALNKYFAENPIDESIVRQAKRKIPEGFGLRSE